MNTYNKMWLRIVTIALFLSVMGCSSKSDTVESSGEGISANSVSSNEGYANLGAGSSGRGR